MQLIAPLWRPQWPPSVLGGWRRFPQGARPGRGVPEVWPGRDSDIGLLGPSSTPEIAQAGVRPNTGTMRKSKRPDRRLEQTRRGAAVRLCLSEATSRYCRIDTRHRAVTAREDGLPRARGSLDGPQSRRAQSSTIRSRSPCGKCASIAPVGDKFSTRLRNQMRLARLNVKPSRCFHHPDVAQRQHSR